MTASSDKVQHYLQQSLQQSLPLIHRGIFSQSELQSIMLRRQKCEHAMLKTTYQKTDYLSSLEYEYEVERERRKRMADMSKVQEGSNPLFRKETGADYAIVKRIIRLWDRTMHKFKFQLSLWKQYLSFTIAINSKKHFFKALTQALRFLPYQVDLWKIGAAYEMEKGLNMWKGRRLIFKGLKMVPEGKRNLELSEFMVLYEIQFLRRLIERKNILVKGEAPLKMIGADQNEIHSQEEEGAEEPEPETIDLTSYDEVIWLVVEEAFTKNCNSSAEALQFNAIRDRFRTILVQSKKEETNSEVKVIITKVISKLNEFSGDHLPERAREVKEEQGIKIEGAEQPSRTILISQDVNDWKEKIFQNGNINWNVSEQALKSFCLKPEKLADLYSFLLSVDPVKALHFITTKKNTQKLPLSTLSCLISLYLDGESVELSSKVIKTQIDRWVTSDDLRNGGDLFQKISIFNKKQNRFQSTTRLLRSLSINYRHEPQYLALCNKISSIS